MSLVAVWQEPDDVIELIARDHQQLHSLLEQLKSAVRSGDSNSARRVLLDTQIVESRHFASEEAAMRRLGYPAYEEHTNDHERLRDSLEAVGRFLLLEEPRRLHDGVVEYLEQTLTHIEMLDMPLQEFLHAQQEAERSGQASSEPGMPNPGAAGATTG